MAANERDLVARLLRQSILTLCRETISYSHSLEVDGIVCITPENETQQIVIKVHEQILKQSCLVSPENGGYSSSSLKPTLCKSCDSPTCFADSIPKTSDAEMRREREMIQENNANCTSDMQIDSGNSEDARPQTLNCDQVEEVSDNITSSLSMREIKDSVFNGNMSSINSRVANIVSNSVEDYTPILVSGIPSLSVMKGFGAISCKRCDAILADVHTYEKHNLAEHSVFTCNICYRTFTARNNLKRHIRLHTGYKPYTCNICSSSFTRKDDLKFHLLKHNYDKPYRCNQCNKGYMDRSCLANHMKNEHNCKLTHVCPQCGEGFSDTHMFMEHKKSHPELKEFQCRLCNFTGINSLMYQKHMLTHGHKKNYGCEPCSVTFEDPFSYTQHLKRHRFEPVFSSYICCFCDNKLPTYKQFIRHEHSHAQSKSHSCPICSKQFRYPSNLREHMMVHESNETDLSKQYWCTECNKGFASEEFLRCHIFEVHETERKEYQNVTNTTPNSIHDEERDTSDSDSLVLPSCHKDVSIDDTTTANHLDVEMLDTLAKDPDLKPSIVKSKERAVSPSMSGSAETMSDGQKSNSPPAAMSNGKVSVKQEMADEFEESSQSSAGSMSPPLPPLGESTKTGDTLKEMSPPPSTETKKGWKSGGHKQPCFERVVTPKIPYRSNVPFTCKDCGDVYNDFEMFETHSSQVHRRFVCEYCGKIFTSKPNRERHVRYHTGERPYHCDLCGQSFFRGDDLKYHRTTRHSDVRPFQCKICGLYFSWPKDLNRHLKSHSLTNL